MNDDRDVDSALRGRSERGVQRGADAVLAAGRRAAANAVPLPTSKSLSSSWHQRPATIAAAALAITAIAGGAFAWRSAGEGTTTVRTNTSAFCDALSARVAPTHNELVVYVDPGASDATRAKIDAALRGDPRVRSRRYVGQKEAYAEFERLFEDRPEKLPNTPPEALLPSFRVQLENPAEGRALAASLRALPGVKWAREPSDVLAEVRVLDVLAIPGVSYSLLDAVGRALVPATQMDQWQRQVAAVRAAADPKTASAVDALAVAYKGNQPMARGSSERAALASSAQLLLEVAESRCQLKLQSWLDPIGPGMGLPSIPSDDPAGN